MYLSFYGLNQKSFQMSTNPSFIWLGKMHKKVLAMLQYGILQNQGFLLLTGDVGTGKTTLVNALINSLGSDVVVAKVPDPGLEMIDFLNYISHTFGMDKRFVCKEDFLIHFDLFLQNSAAAGKKVLLIIDEAQRLNSALLEEIRQLSNIEKQQTKVLNILFVGQNLFHDFLQESQNRALSQRIAINVAIGPLNFDETAEYIRQSLKTAGAEKDIFSADALRSVYKFSAGFLRRINIICDHAMLSGYLQGKKTVTVDMVRQCAEDLCLPDATVQLTPGLLRGVDGYDAQNSQDIVPESVPVIAPIQAWKIIGIVILIVVGVFWATYYNYPEEYQTLFSRIQKNGLQLLHISQKADLANSVNIQNKDAPLLKAVTEDDSGTLGEIGVFEKAAMDVLVAEGQEVEKMAPAEIVLEEQSTDDGPEEPSAAVHPIDTVDLNAIPPIEDNGNGIVEIETIVPLQTPMLPGKSLAAEDETIGDYPDPVATDVSASTAYVEVVDSLIEKMTNDMPVESVETTRPEEVEEAVGALQAPPANVDPSAVIDWVIKKRSE